MKNLTELFLKYYDSNMLHFFSGIVLGLILASGIRMIRSGIEIEEVSEETEEEDETDRR